MNLKDQLEEARRIEETYKSQYGREAVFGSRNSSTKKGSIEEREYFDISSQGNI
jgi:hypothetical protein